jgi:hypothetical protein
MLARPEALRQLGSAAGNPLRFAPPLIISEQ